MGAVPRGLSLGSFSAFEACAGDGPDIERYLDLMDQAFLLPSLMLGLNGRIKTLPVAVGDLWGLM